VGQPVDDLLVEEVPRWLSLARGLSEVAPSWVACKSVGGAATEAGDLSSTAPVQDWDALTEEFRRWAGVKRLGPVVVCGHEPHVRHLVALDGPLRFFALSVRARRVVRGATLFVPVARSLLEPAVLATWVRQRLTRPCAVLEGMAAGRRVPGDRRVWLGDVALDHEVDAAGAVRQQAMPQKS